MNGGSPAGEAQPQAMIRFGTFDAESRWRPDDLARLPAVAAGASAGQAVARMDELLCALTAPGDLLITGGPFPASLRDALGGAGLDFDHRWVGDADQPGESIEARIARSPELVDLIRARGGRLDPFAVIPDTAALSAQLPEQLPDPATVALVNSKTWSNSLITRWGLPGAAVEADSCAALDKAVRTTLAEAGAAVVKDPYGVAGRGSLEIGSERALSAVLRHLGRQERAGARVELLVQPRYARRWDFSAQLRIAPGGQWRLLGTQTMDNRELRHGSSGPVPDDLGRLLQERDYQGILGRVAEALSAAGYWGPACVDSLVCADGQWAPLLEINARQSLGLLNLSVDRRAARYGLRSRLWQADASVAAGRGIDDLVTALRGAGILYAAGPRPGVLPLAAGSLTHPAGRLHCAILSPDGAAGSWPERIVACAREAGIVLRGVAGTGR